MLIASHRHTQCCQLVPGGLNFPIQLRVWWVYSKRPPPRNTPSSSTRPLAGSRPRPGPPAAARITSRLTPACHCVPSAQTASQRGASGASPRHHCDPAAKRPLLRETPAPEPDERPRRGGGRRAQGEMILRGSKRTSQLAERLVDVSAS